MKNNSLISIKVLTFAALLSLSVVGCSNAQNSNAAVVTSTQAAAAQAAGSTASSGTTSSTEAATTTTTTSTDTTALFSDRDLEQTADLTAATQMKLVSNQDVTLSEEGVYVLSGDVDNVTVTVEAAEEAKVQIVLDGVSITNTDSPAIYVKAADKVFVTSTDSENHMEVTGSYVADGETHLDAVIFSRADVTLNGTGSLDIVSAQGNGISSKDDLKITGGVYTIQSSADALEANDAILINDGTITIDTGKDALHSENEEDTTLGNIYIEGGTLNIKAADDGITANNLVQIDGGIINIETAVEGIEGNTIIVNDGQITVYATDDGINATPKVNDNASIEVNGGTIKVSMGSGDTDAFDSNGNLYINGGVIDVEATSAFDADGTAELNGGTVTVNGEQITEITQSRGGGGGFRGGGGGMGH
ncbi:MULTISPECIES: carbohydrate-binding domain-containing protein [unclassified Paenibacillus]|uniref:carbohydrate-binding domain-containing protein n=1 Tax=unclassified Paenibacillus TaxID=185978 RepID=UPI002406ED48|nr:MULTISPECIES: carbohydrate-binding domain-containing protein [unclassified Paenibacillus]MDF9843729.1 lipopolysaccharide assembly outer membrane protein LptD (OstA) [Paenibacillus sp. PastF-2]MDF9851775.1 lipopolysaccharide assembly outer membrane protein LptD (OstA) [Paenibacillus sp. PastM-2]MDF9858357.1 lipopolysaccharide assembly outer membrane protein LptD (OstA) [Paenibacillus sp. PastF-1]MDH6483645.1 lipopolysaccharide assembly outer membrane protein LptD (OstA) [Paenibacillus sp. Pas